jgi:hypothetical protein
VIALLRTVRDLASRRTPITPRWCPRHRRTVLRITEQQRKAALADGYVTCTCGEPLGTTGVTR